MTRNTIQNNGSVVPGNAEPPTKNRFRLLEPILALIRSRLIESNLDFDVRVPLRSVSLWLDLYRPPVYAEYRPAEIFRRHPPADASRVIEIEPVNNCVGDLEQVAACVHVLMSGVELLPGSQLVAELFQQPDPPVSVEPVPCIGLGFDGPGRFSKEFVIDHYAAITMDDLASRWTAATRGGRLDAAPNGLLLRLTGMRMTPEPNRDLEPVRQRVGEAIEKLDSGDRGAALAALEEALALLDGRQGAAEPSDITVLVNEVHRESKTTLDAAGITVEIVFSSPVPPILVRRAVLRRFLLNLFQLTRELAAPGGSLMILAGYSPPLRQLDCMATIAGNGSVRLLDAYRASFSRALKDMNSGHIGFSLEESAREISLTLSIPDLVAKALDTWIPNWDRFSERSQQVLRLLKGGAEGLPENLILEGVLEEELDRWLMPHLDKPPAVNVAHELASSKPPHPASSPERLKKALEQIRRGKPRRELAKPACAAELVYAFRTEERHRRAIGAGNRSAEDLRQLAEWLWQSPPPCLDCLRLIAGIR